jgi:hypothetical protein
VFFMFTHHVNRLWSGGIPWLKTKRHEPPPIP